jgi:hypothetical protein
MVPIGRGVQHEYQDMMRGFTCCVGTGMENHGLHGDGIYYESGDKLWVNLYAPSTANWQSEGVAIAVETTFPEGDAATLRISTPKAKQFALELRRPTWAGSGFTVKVNGVALKDVSHPGSYVEVKRTWKNGDSVSLVLPKTLRIEATPDNPNRVALMWGPLVLAGDLGAERERRGGQTAFIIPSFVSDSAITDWLKPVAGKPGNFQAAGRDVDDRVQEVSVVPFYRLHRRTYAIYFDVYNSDGWKNKLAEVAAQLQRQRKLEAATISFVQPGEVQKEKEFNQQGEESTVDRSAGRPARRGRKWFSFDLPVQADQPTTVVATYFSEEHDRRSFEILADGQRIGEQTIERVPYGSAEGNFFDVQYKIPDGLLKNKKKITVRFQATGNDEIAAVYGVRLIRADAAQ